jgi:hypothetical protein
VTPFLSLSLSLCCCLFKRWWKCLVSFSCLQWQSLRYNNTEVVGDCFDCFQTNNDDDDEESQSTKMISVVAALLLNPTHVLLFYRRYLLRQFKRRTKRRKGVGFQNLREIQSNSF